MTLKDAFLYGKRLLKEAGITEFETDAWLLLEEAAGCTRNDLYVRGDQELEKSSETLYKEFLEKRKSRIPVQQILGVQNFCGLAFIVTEDVLCPRLDTEVLVEEALKRIHPGSRLLDVCTGSGCILLSLLHFRHGCTGVGVDLSEAALKIAEKNARKLGIAAEFLHSDLFDQVEGMYDVIVSNPPYIATKEIEMLEPEVRDREPRMALDGKEDGLFFYRKIIGEADAYLNPKGWLIFEIGYDQGMAVSSMMREKDFEEVAVIKDLAGLDRVVIGRKR